MKLTVKVPLSLRGFAMALAYPAAIMLLFWSLMAHLYFGINGSWPSHIHDHPRTWLFTLHMAVTILSFLGGLVLLVVSPVAFVTSLFFRPARHWAAYVAVAAFVTLGIYNATLGLVPDSVMRILDF